MSYLEEMKKRVDFLINSKRDIIVLGIETSCDETSIAVVKNGREILSNVVSSQIEIHTKFGGVVPEVASRNHIASINNIFEEAIKEAKIKKEEIDAVAVTYGAGLIGALFVGVNFAKALAYSLNVPLIAVNHIQGHIASNYLAFKELEPPFMCLLVSGAHTSIFNVKNYCELEQIGQTVDDAIGEAFDKIARVMGLGYPGGPKVEKEALKGEDCIIFKKQNSLKNSYNFTFSGIKTAVINYLSNQKSKGEEINVPNVCASFQHLVAKELSEKVFRAIKENGEIKTLVIAGGVSANRFIFNYLKQEGEKCGVKVYAPPINLCTDNAGMIASCGYYNLINKVGISDIDLTAKAHIDYDVLKG